MEDGRRKTEDGRTDLRTDRRGSRNSYLDMHTQYFDASTSPVRVLTNDVILPLANVTIHHKI